MYATRLSDLDSLSQWHPTGSADANTLGRHESCLCGLQPSIASTFVIGEHYVCVGGRMVRSAKGDMRRLLSGSRLWCTAGNRFYVPLMLPALAALNITAVRSTAATTDTREMTAHRRWWKTTGAGSRRHV